MSYLALAKAAEDRMRKENRLFLQTESEVFEYVDGQFKSIDWTNFVNLTVRDVCRRPLILKAHGLYFVGDGWETDVGKIVARKHPCKVRHLIEWLEIILPYWSSELMDKRLIDVPLRKINEGNASEVLARIKKLSEQQAEMMA